MPGPAQPDRYAEPVATARDRDALQRERGKRSLGRQRPPAAALAARLDRLAPDAIACSHAAKKPGSITESASSISTASQSSERAYSRPAWRAAARPGGSSGPRSSTDAPNERAISAVRSVHRSATTSTDRARRRSAMIASSPRPITCSSLCAGTSTRNRISGWLAWPRLAVEPRPPAPAVRDGPRRQAGQANHDRGRDSECLMSSASFP